MGLSVWSREMARVPTVRGALRIPEWVLTYLGEVTKGFLRMYPMSEYLRWSRCELGVGGGQPCPDGGNKTPCAVFIVTNSGSLGRLR